MRADLLALSDDDLAALSNRGTAKRARAEVEAGTPTVEISEAADGTVTARWSDDVECTIPGGLSIARGRCTCPASPPCRHLVRTAMAYRARAASAPADPANDAPVAKIEIAASLRDRAAKRFDEGQLFELTRGAKPIARCHSLGVVTRFYVAGDPNHSLCDCGDPAPCEHAVMAVRAFELLPSDAQSGLVDTRSTPYPIPSNALDALEAMLVEWTRVGLADAPTSLVDRARNVEAACRKAGLAWIAECLDELVTLKAGYDARDARFDAAQLARIVGEMVARADATRVDRGLVPQLFVRGSATDRTVDITSARLVGLGCDVRVRRSTYELTAFMQAEDSGQVVAVVRELAHRVDETKPLSDAGRIAVSKGITLANVSAGRTLLKGGRRSAGGVLSFGRAPASCQPQAFAWEKLRAPVLADGFGEVVAHLEALPPRPLRPRRLAEDVFVLPIGEVVESGFDRVTQSVKAIVRDPHGVAAIVSHPFYVRAAAGTNAFLAAFAKERVVFVAGRARLVAGALSIEPFGVVIEKDGARRLVQPWIEPATAAERADSFQAGAEEQLDPSRFVTEELANALGELLVIGLEGRTPVTESQWRERAKQAVALGFDRLTAQIDALASRPDPARVLAAAAMISFADSV